MIAGVHYPSDLEGGSWRRRSPHGCWRTRSYRPICSAPARTHQPAVITSVNNAGRHPARCPARRIAADKRPPACRSSGFAPQRRQQRGPTGAGRQAVIHPRRACGGSSPGADGVVLQRRVGQTPGSPRAGEVLPVTTCSGCSDAIHAGRHHPLQRERMIALVFSAARRSDGSTLQPMPGRLLTGLLIAAKSWPRLCV